MGRQVSRFDTEPFVYAVFALDNHRTPWYKKVTRCRVTSIPPGEKEDSSSMAAEGTIKWFNEKKGYGFIQQDNGQDIFVHYSSIVADGFKTLAEGERVKFEIEEGAKGLKAVNVMKL